MRNITFKKTATILAITAVGMSQLSAQQSPKSFTTAHYPNYLRQAGYSNKAINDKIQKAYDIMFTGKDKVYFEVEDSMGYISDLKNKDVRTEGLSYGMMAALQMDKKEVFDRIWRWSQKYMQHHSGPREGYFAWSYNTNTHKINAEGAAPDGELYFITSLLLASNKWGDQTGINYYQEARYILDNMWKKNGEQNVYNLFQLKHKLLAFVPEGRGYDWTDPSYQLPAFMNVWAALARDDHEIFYAEAADSARTFLHKACDRPTALNSDYTRYNGQPLSTPWMPTGFRYDSWRVPMNIAMDYYWIGIDSTWQKNYAKKIQRFFISKGLRQYGDQFNLDGSTPDSLISAGNVKKLRHSIGLIATLATTEMIHTDTSHRFIKALWNAKLEPYEDGFFDSYYDGFLYLFSLLHLSGNYQISLPKK